MLKASNDIKSFQSSMQQKSSTDFNSQLALLRSEFLRLTRDEDYKRKIQNQFKAELQEAWDKLVNLRTHIKIFRSSIEDAKIEEIAFAAESEGLGSHSDSIFGKGAPLTKESASRLADIHIIREKVRLKEGLRCKVALAEELVSNLKRQLSEKSEALLGINVSMQSSESASALQMVAVGKASRSVSQYMELRRSLLALSNEIEDAEANLTASQEELEKVESDVETALKKANDSQRAKSEAGSRLVSSATSHPFSEFFGVNFPVESLYSGGSSEEKAGRDGEQSFAAAMEGGKLAAASALSSSAQLRNAQKFIGSMPSSAILSDISLHEVLSGQAGKAKFVLCKQARLSLTVIGCFSFHFYIFSSISYHETC